MIRRAFAIPHEDLKSEEIPNQILSFHLDLVMQDWQLKILLFLFCLFVCKILIFHIFDVYFQGCIDLSKEIVHDLSLECPKTAGYYQKVGMITDWNVAHLYMKTNTF